MLLRSNKRKAPPGGVYPRGVSFALSLVQNPPFRSLEHGRAFAANIDFFCSLARWLKQRRRPRHDLIVLANVIKSGRRQQVVEVVPDHLAVIPAPRRFIKVPPLCRRRRNHAVTGLTLRRRNVEMKQQKWSGRCGKTLPPRPRTTERSHLRVIRILL